LISLAKDFFTKLCSYPASERYDAQKALHHPWITGIGGVNDIPLTRKQQLARFDSQMGLKKAMHTLLFCAVIAGKGRPREHIDRDYIQRVLQHSQDS
jgi:hypothetical protein